MEIQMSERQKGDVMMMHDYDDDGGGDN